MTLAGLVADVLSIQYEKRLLIFDTEGFRKAFDYTKILTDSSYNVVSYNDIESFRLQFEKEISASDDSWAVIVTDDSYVPYDVRKVFYEIQLSMSTVFPKLDDTALWEHVVDLDIISFTYGEMLAEKRSTRDTERFISDMVFSAANVKKYLSFRKSVLIERISSNAKPISYSEWIDIAQIKAAADVYAARARFTVDWSFIDDAFATFAISDYSRLSGQTSSVVPTILPKVFDYIAKGKTALIVMDGMSLFDFNIIVRYFDGIEYEQQCSYALIPTTTNISRQCLLTGDRKSVV